ncbi:MBL fold metallo-hydrolase [Arthrobacter sp. MYb227]|uniref:MBL fold metallo-hydrolase n=1 Tax=Arthrobacter sp. MYb227 TaxID=1848601 RepID=UPI000CFAAF4C|nr:MBL fold metallo-hydrolase [Arthrobacter sp. MYb227]PQZ88561.1 MBL fold metallo-hydrolase [Arthrobacter sp. MYb227]
MEIQKFSHACIRLSHRGRALVLDPGNFSPLDRAMADVEAVLITHEHADHLDIPAVLAVLGANPQITVYAPGTVAKQVLAAIAASEDVAVSGIETESINTVEVGEHFSVAGMEISTHGGAHAIIHSSLPRVANIGYFINEFLYHPGDSYQVPEGISIKTLLVPLHAPWAKIGETLDFVASVGAAQNFPIHDGLLNERGLSMFDGHLTRICTAAGAGYQRLGEEPLALDAPS